MDIDLVVSIAAAVREAINLRRDGAGYISEELVYYFFFFVAHCCKACRLNIPTPDGLTKVHYQRESFIKISHRILNE